MSRDNAGRFTKGASGNPSGVAKAKNAPGWNGVRIYFGQVQTGEISAKLTGIQKWVTYANAHHRPPVAIARILRSVLLSGAKWTAIPNKAGGKDAQRGAEIVEEGLFNARLATGDTWGEIVAKAGNGSYFEGASLHAFGIARRPDGMAVFSDISHRPMWTIEGWHRSAPNRPIDTVEQRTDIGKTDRIPLSECLYIVERMLSDDPFGVGVLRLIVDRIERANRYENLEGSEMFTSMGGTPIYRAPFEEISRTLSDSLTDEERQAQMDQRCQSIINAVANRVKTPEVQQYLGLDSATYQGTDPNSISSIQKWAIEILKGELQGLADIRKTITDFDLDLARILGVEWVFIGGGDSAGTYGMHESKVGMFSSTLQASLDRVANRARDQLARRLVAANGLDPDTATPMLRPEKLSTTAILDAVSALEGLARANLHPKDPVRNLVRERLEFPPEPEQDLIADLMAPRAPRPFPPAKADDEEDEEIDVIDEEDGPTDPSEVDPTDDEEDTEP